MRRSGILWPGVLALAVIGLALNGLAVTRAGAQPGWTLLTPATSPAARYYHAMTYDPVRAETVLFGGMFGSTYHGDTWVWDGANWTRKTPTKTPSARRGAAMAADAARKRVVLFGGEATAKFGDTWEWDGATWVLRTPTTSPPARASHAMAYDPVRRRVVLFGGYGATGRLTDTWEWDGVNWKNVTPAVSPPVSSPGPYGLVYDTTRRRIHAWCGGSPWLWDGATWTRLNPILFPWNMAGRVSMACDTHRGRVVFFPGGPAATTWEWDGVTWAERVNLASPSLRTGHVMVYDSHRMQLVMFGGHISNSPSGYTNETWEYTFGLTIWPGGPPNRGSTVKLNLIAQGQAGRPYQVGSSLGAGPIPIGGRAIGLSPDSLLTVSVAGTWPGIFQAYRGVIDAFGIATAAIAIPSHAGLIGVTVHSACITLNPVLPFGIQAVSPTVSFKIL